MQNDLISRSALLEAMPKNDEIFSFEVRRVICNAPAVDAEVVRHGKWEAVENTGPEEWCAPPIRCSNCGKTMPDVGADFCPFCGAKMDGEQNDIQRV